MNRSGLASVSLVALGAIIVLRLTNAGAARTDGPALMGLALVAALCLFILLRRSAERRRARAAAETEAESTAAQTQRTEDMLRDMIDERGEDATLLRRTVQSGGGSRVEVLRGAIDAFRDRHGGSDVGAVTAFVAAVAGEGGTTVDQAPDPDLAQVWRRRLRAHDMARPGRRSA